MIFHWHKLTKNLNNNLNLRIIDKNDYEKRVKSVFLSF